MDKEKRENAKALLELAIKLDSKAIVTLLARSLARAGTLTMVRVAGNLGMKAETIEKLYPEIRAQALKISEKKKDKLTKK